MSLTLLRMNAEIVLVPLIAFIAFETIFAILFFLGERPTTKKIQVGLLFFISFFVIASNLLIYQVGYILLIFVYFLSKKYGVFNKSQFLFYTVLAICLLLSMFLSTITNPFDSITTVSEITILHILNQLGFIIASLLLIVFVFEDDIKRLTKENRKLGSQIDKSRIFVNLGEHIAGLVHNLKNDLTILSVSIEVLGHRKGVELDHLISGQKRLQAKVDNIMTIASLSQAVDDIEFSLNSLIDSLLEIFLINKEYRIVEIEKDYQEDIVFFGNASEISQLFENLIKNAFEALIEKSLNDKAFKPSLKISIKENGYKMIEISDNGPGIKSCMDENHTENCEDCDVFKPGKTTKESGTGLGMISVFKTLKKYKGTMKINTSTEGTNIKVMF